MKKKALLATAALLVITSGLVYSHCEIPCGIYDDKIRIALLLEDITTIEKSMTQIVELSGKHDALSANQLTRWVSNKETHADKIQHTVTQYFMTQRIKHKEGTDKEAHARYLTQITTLHAMLIEAMKCKQTVSPQHVQKLRGLVETFATAYFNAEDLEHLKEEHKGHRR